MYELETFQTLLALKCFLNNNNIKPKDIININANNDCYMLLYYDGKRTGE